MRTLISLLLLWPVSAFAQNTLRNPGFEPPEQGGLAEAWRSNCYGECITRFSLDTVNPHSGKTCQKIECVQRRGGASQFLQPLAVQAGKLYRVRIWVRAEGNVPWVSVGLRQIPEPYKMHASGQCEPGTDWELVEFEGVSLEPDEQAGFFIWFQAEGSGTVWVDDASVEVSDPVAENGPAPEGNVVPNGSFEMDPTRTWDSTGAPADWPSTQYAAHGTRSMHVRLAKDKSFLLRTPCIAFYGNNEEFTLACSARAAGAPVALDVRVQLAMRAQQSEAMLSLSAAPDGSLRRFAARGRLASSLNGAYYLEVSGKAEGNAEVWLDAISLSRKGEAFEPAAPLEASLSTRVFDNIFAPGEPVRVKLEAFSAGPSVQNEVRLQVRDYTEALVTEKRVPLQVAAGSLDLRDRAPRPLAAREVTLPVGRLGAFRVDAVTADGQPPLASMVFSVIPRPAGVPAEGSIVGGHFATDSDWQLQIAQRLGYKWTRIHDCSQVTHWRSSEPEPGQWKFYDDQVKRVRAAGLRILGEFLRVPDWATKAPKDSPAYRSGVGPFRDTGEFENYVRTVVTRYKGWIHHWEIWNEPYGGGFFGGTPEEYGALAVAAARAAKVADPSCRLLAPCTFPGASEWTDKAIGAGAIRSADIFSYHGYGCLGKTSYDNVTKWAACDNNPMPIWNTETGVTARTFYRHTTDRLMDEYTRWIAGVPMEQAVQESLKLFVLAIAGGAQRYFYYWTNVEPAMCPRMTSMSIYEYDKTLRPHGVVYAIAGTLLDPCKGAGIRELPHGIICCLLERKNETVAVVWAKSKTSAGSRTLEGLPTGTRALDVMGNSLATEKDGALSVAITKTPLYLIAPKAGGAKLVASIEKACR